jgi:uracil phosphoribosyltransferase
VSQVFVLDHPLVQHKLTVLRRADTSSAKFRSLAREVSLLLGYEVTRNLRLRQERIDTPLEAMDAPVLEGHMPCIISILRAGQGILDGMIDLMPTARIGHIGLYRDPATLAAVEYYLKVPEDIALRPVIVVDPMLATGHSAAAAISRLKQAGATDLRFACLLAAPEGLAHLQELHPDVPIFTAALDRGLDTHGYIRPGLGDAGDRLFGTK